MTQNRYNMVFNSIVKNIPLQRPGLRFSTSRSQFEVETCDQLNSDNETGLDWDGGLN